IERATVVQRGDRLARTARGDGNHRVVTIEPDLQVVAERGRIAAPPRLRQGLPQIELVAVLQHIAENAVGALARGRQDDRVAAAAVLQRVVAGAGVDRVPAAGVTDRVVARAGRDHVATLVGLYC